MYSVALISRNACCIDRHLINRCAGSFTQDVCSWSSWAPVAFFAGASNFLLLSWICPHRHPKQVNAAASVIQRHVHPDANIIIGALVDERCGKQVSVTVLATGFGVSPTCMCLACRASLASFFCFVYETIWML